MSLVEVALSTLRAVELGRYDGPAGPVELGPAVAETRRRTQLYRPADLERLLALAPPPPSAPPALAIDVTDETTASAARRLVEAGVPGVALLNFASARNPGGGFLGGARAQEEDLCRCSALYPCLVEPSAFAYYEANRAHPSALYTDHMIHSPAVPFFRGDRYEWLLRPFLVDVVTAPAPNAGAWASHGGDLAALHAAFDRRIGLLLALLAAAGHRQVVLGAWGCGAFRNDPAEIAALFAAHLAAPRWRAAFERVVFAIHDRTKDRGTLRAFQARFGA